MYYNKITEKVELSEQEKKDGCWIKYHCYEFTEEYDLMGSDGNVLQYAAVVFDMR